MSQDYTDDELRERDEQIQQAHDERVHKYLSGDAIKKYMDLGMKPVRFKDLRKGERFAFTRSPFDSPKLHGKTTDTLALREDNQQVQLYPDWWTGSYRI